MGKGVTASGPDGGRPRGRTTWNSYRQAFYLAPTCSVVVRDTSSSRNGRVSGLVTPPCPSQADDCAQYRTNSAKTRHFVSGAASGAHNLIRRTGTTLGAAMAPAVLELRMNTLSVSTNPSTTMMAASHRDAFLFLGLMSLIAIVPAAWVPSKI